MSGLDLSGEQQQAKNNARPIHRPTRSTHTHKLLHGSSSGFSRFLPNALAGGVDRASDHAGISHTSEQPVN